MARALFAALALLFAHGASALSAPRSPMLARARPHTAVSAGFGKGEAKAGDSKTAKGKLNGQKQWDRYIDLAKRGGIVVEVAVRKDAESEWKTVGRVCAVAELPAAAAAARQRVLIEEHGKRVHLGVMAEMGKAPLQVGVRAADGFELVGKKDRALVSSDEQLGFEGLPDTRTGYYCHYDSASSSPVSPRAKASETATSTDAKWITKK
ncbi:hypothetical protein T492DRAFT_141147 [Pavlovales sp. CCMP2436]|nr:hypothetical protein T492DRAFT_141147 [Pavlovales sp. CCMP2436]